MILSAIKARAMPYVYLLIGLLIIGLAGLVYWLYKDNQHLSGEIERLDQANEQLADSARNQAAENAALDAELKRRDQLALEAVRNRQKAASDARKQRQGIEDAIKDNDCASEPHPAAVGDWLRKHSDDL